MPHLTATLLAALTFGAPFHVPSPRMEHASVSLAIDVAAQQTGAGRKGTDKSSAKSSAKGAAKKRTTAKSSSTTKSTTRKSTARKSTTTKSSAKTSPTKKASSRAPSRTKAKTRTAAPKKSAPRRPPPVWPVKGPDPLPGSILPGKRIVAYYGNPLSRRMGVLGEYEPRSMLRRLDREVEAWEAADTLTPVVPALHLIVTVAQGSPGKDGKWRTRMADSLVERVYDWAHKRQALLFLDVQIAKSTLQDELPWLEKYLARPDVHLGIDPEFAMKGGHAPGKRVGSYDARDVNWTVDFLGAIVDKYQLPPKVLVIHRFTRPMLTNADRIRLDPRVQIVIDMDGWGSPAQKRATYEAYVASEPVQFTGFKLFYKNDVRQKGWRLMRPADVLALDPKPVYIQYQ